MDRIPTQLRALPYRLPQQNVRNKHENRPTKSERHTQHEGKRERAKFYYWNYQVTCRKSDVVIYSSSPKKKKQKKNTRDEREGFFFTGRIITFNQFLEGERRVVRSGFRMTNLIWRKGSWDGEGGILGTFLRFVFFLLLRTQQIMDFFRTQLTNWLLATNKKKTTKHCIRYFYRGRQNEEAHFGHTKTKLFFSICLFHSFHLPDD